MMAKYGNKIKTNITTKFSNDKMCQYSKNTETHSDKNNLYFMPEKVCPDDPSEKSHNTTIQVKTEQNDYLRIRDYDSQPEIAPSWRRARAQRNYMSAHEGSESGSVTRSIHDRNMSRTGSIEAQSRHAWSQIDPDEHKNLQIRSQYRPISQNLNQSINTQILKNLYESGNNRNYFQIY